MTEKTEKQIERLLSQMQPNVEYKVEEAAMWLNVGQTRARTLLKMLVADGKISETGAAKMKRYTGSDLSVKNTDKDGAAVNRIRQ